MFLMPYLKHAVKTSFPFGVVLIVAANLLVYFGFQQRDAHRYQRAYDYYQHSILVRLEPPAYVDHLRQQGKDKARARFQRAQLDGNLPYLVQTMADDAGFMAKLRSGQVVPPEHPDYGQWLQARRYFDGIRESMVTEQYAFRTDKPSLLTAFTHQFLHGDMSHLAGNMITFILIAPAVEAILGTSLFLTVYLVGGLGAVGMHWLIVGSGSGLIGASGAISAVMGAFAALFRWRRIPFFYFVVVYFDVIRAPALLALPIWVVNEFLQLVWFGNRGIAYGAHIGGLLVGGLLAWPLAGRVAQRFAEAPAADAKDGKTDDDIETAMALAKRHLAKGRQLVREHRFDEARQAYARAAGCAGLDAAALRECFNIAKLSPGSKEFHLVARAILGHAGDQDETHQLVVDTFGEYLGLAQPRPFLNGDILAGLAGRFRRRRCMGELDRVARLFHNIAPTHPSCREVLLAAAQCHQQAGDGHRAAELAILAKSATAT
ncbi:MAG TPA: rhomboid family intramembrane serine protease [Rhodocyclaceae bacterium]|nr:rhomboid family intramembrane serine protease [Rhodocyclaceae bacterium]